VTVQADHMESLIMMPVFKLPVNSLEMISLYQLHIHTCWISGKHYHSLYRDSYVLTLCGRLEACVFVFDWPTW